jgi:N-methylhydantoinase B
MDAVDTLFANTRNNPIEDIESHLPLRVTRYELREDVVGAGRTRGGVGAIREFEFLSDGGISVEGEGHRYRPWGFAGGHEGRPAELQVTRDGAAEPLPSKVPYRPARKGDRFMAVGPAGGGYGDPRERDPQKVRADVRDGLVSAETARDVFGVEV